MSASAIARRCRSIRYSPSANRSRCKPFARPNVGSSRTTSEFALLTKSPCDNVTRSPVRLLVLARCGYVVRDRRRPRLVLSRHSSRSRRQASGHFGVALGCRLRRANRRTVACRARSASSAGEFARQFRPPALRRVEHVHDVERRLVLVVVSSNRSEATRPECASRFSSRGYNSIGARDRAPQSYAVMYPGSSTSNSFVTPRSGNPHAASGRCQKTSCVPTRIGGKRNGTGRRRPRARARRLALCRRGSPADRRGSARRRASRSAHCAPSVCGRGRGRSVRC